MSEPNGLLTKTDADEPETTERRRLDPEIRAISAIIRVLDDAAEERVSVARIVRYLVDRYAREVPLIAEAGR